MDAVKPGLFARLFTTESPPATATGSLHYVKERTGERQNVWPDLVQTVRRHYIAPEDLRTYCEVLGYADAAEAISVFIPKDSKSRSGELGEALATEYVNEALPVRVHIKRLRNKDERETALRGDDLLGVAFNDQQILTIVKGEVKSTQGLTSATLDEAETKLLQHAGRPSRHSLGLVAAHLLRVDQELGVAVLKYNLSQAQADLSHLIVTLTQFKPAILFPKRLAGAYPAIQRMLVGLIISNHKQTVSDIYAELENRDSIEREVAL